MLPAAEGIKYQLIRSRRRTISVEVDHSSNVIVRAPSWVSAREIQRFVYDRHDWISGKVAEAHARRTMIPQRTADNQLYHRGSLLSWGWQDADIILPGSTLPHQAESWLATWQRRQAEQVFSSVIHEYLPLLGVPALRYTGLRLRKMRRRWGSCTRTGMITLNVHLVRTPDICIRGVVVHELCHLVHLDHGPGFRSLVAEVYPDFRLSDTLLSGWNSIIDMH
ncbi:MAG: M48 family metallopeptidase [Candidatus Kapaibacterium sp.]